MSVLYSIFCTILIAIQAIIYNRFKKNGKSNDWNLLIGISISSMISTIITFCILEKVFEYSLGNLINNTITCIISMIINFVFFISTLTLRNENIKFKFVSVVVGLLVIVVNLLIFLIIPIFNDNVPEKSMAKNTTSINYKYDLNGISL